MEREWRDVPGYEGNYQVSNLGEVLSVRRRVRNRNGYFWTKGKMLKPTRVTSGHLMVGLYTTGIYKATWASVHRLVLLAFVGPCPDGMEACHFPDIDKTNNRLDNLRWDTHKANVQDSIIQGAHCRGERGGNAKLKEEDIPFIRAMNDGVYGRMSEVARSFGVNAATIRDIWVGKTWRHV